jgi:hypothetical protein
MRPTLPLLALLAGLAPTLVHAGDGIRPRTPMTWNDTPCATLVDRTATPTVNVAYGVAFDDTEITADEVDDGRRHQFFATCRDNGRHELLPRWITQADVDAADAVGIVPKGGIEAAQILEGNPAWDGCWVRINADDDRRPITAARPPPASTGTSPTSRPAPGSCRATCGTRSSTSGIGGRAS